MKLQIRSVKDKGVFEKERLIMKVLSDTDIGDYILLQTDFYDGEVTIGVHNVYWFPYKKVLAGDLVVLYTKSGSDIEHTSKRGAKAHFFYWGLSKPIWNRKDVAPVILYARAWESKVPDEL